MGNLIGDLRLGFRHLRRRPTFTVMIVLILALGIGANTAIFSVVNGVLLQPLPYPGAEALMQVETVFQSGATGNTSNPDYEDLRAQNRSFAGLAAYGSWTTSASMAGRGFRTHVAATSANFFAVLGVEPMRGRAYLTEEERTGRRVAVISYGYWRDHLGGGDLRQQRVRVGDQSYTVIGVMPSGFDFPHGTQLWVPRQVQTSSRTAQNWHVVGRLRDGVSPAGAQQDLSAIARRIKTQYGENTYMTDASVRPLKDRLVGGVRRALLVLLVAAGLLFLVACVNVVNLLLSRVISRDREWALRLALGARPMHLVRGFLTESLILSLIGSGLGVILAMAGVPALLALAPGNLPRSASVGVDWVVLAFALSASLVTALMIGLLPALRAAHRDARACLGGGRGGEGGPAGSRRVRGALVASQVALTVALLVAVGILGRSFLKLSAVDPGYRTRGAVVMDLWLPSPHDAAGTIRNAHLLARLIDRLHRLPGVERVGGVNAFPLQGGNTQNGTFLILQRPDEVSDFEDFERLSHQPARTGEAEYRVASGGYFGAMGIPLVRGRLFDERDSFEAPNVAVISASLARSRWPNEDPIGKLIQFGNMDGDLRPFTIVGIVGDVREESIDEASRPTFYASYRQRAVAGFHVAIQERGDIGVLTSSARRVAADMSPTVPVHFESVTQIVSSSLADRRFLLLLLGLFAALALVLATTGVYGIVAYGASQRTSEIGVRMALGARGGDIVRLLVRQGATYAAAGVAVGLGVALALSRFLRSLCYGITTTDPVSFVVTSIALLAAAIAASWIPARRASRIDPMEALRHE